MNSLIDKVLDLATQLNIEKDYVKSLNPMYKKTIPSGPFYTGAPSRLATLGGKSDFTTPGATGGSPSPAAGVGITSESRKRKYWKS